MKAILGKKIGMSQVFSPTGERVSVTLISCEPNHVTLKRINDKDGYAAVQLALPKKVKKGEKQPNKPKQNKRIFAAKKEFKITEDIGEKNTFDVNQFEIGDIVEVVGKSKGKGFQGAVKRHNFSGGPASHGHRHALRSPGSIGSAFPQHVMKGKKMAGRMGSDKTTVKNLKIMWIDNENNLLAVSGAVPGPKGNVVAIKSTVVKNEDNA